MITLISQAKSYDFESSVQKLKATGSDFKEESTGLIKTMVIYSSKKLSALINITSEHAALNVDRYQKWTSISKREDIKQTQLKTKIITPIFNDLTYAKNASSVMAYYITKNRITDSELLNVFNCNGYNFGTSKPDDRSWVSLRD